MTNRTWMDVTFRNETSPERYVLNIPAMPHYGSDKK